MSFFIEKDEATAGRRFVPFRLFDSTGTAPFTAGSGNTMLGSLNGAAQLSLGSVSAVSANAGMYGFQLTQSNVSTLGSLALYTDNVANYPQHVATALIVNSNPFSTQSNVTAVSVSGINAGIYSGVSLEIKTGGIQAASVGIGNYSGVSIEIKSGGIQATSIGAGNYSGMSIEVKTGGIQTTSVGVGNYSGVSVEIKTSGIATNSINSATYSGVTLGVSNIAPGTYSGVSIEVKSGGIQAGSIGVGNYSGMSVEIKSGGIQTSSVGIGSYSGVSIEVKSGGIQTGSIGAGSYSGVTIDGARFLSAAGERSNASSLLSTNMGNTHLVQEALFALRNKVDASASVLTVYLPDGITSAWTASITTVASVNIVTIAPTP